MPLSEVIELITPEPEVLSSIEGVGDSHTPDSNLIHKGLETTIYEL